MIEEKDQQLIGDNLFQTLLHLNSKKIIDNLEEIGQPFNRNEFDMSPQTINACYNQTNRMTIPLAMMQQPMYDENGDYAENLGRLGMIVAHELSHGFDSSCIFFDENGNYNPDWAVFLNKNGEEKLYFVIETKGSLNPYERKGKENLKIHCGKQHFKALDNRIELKEAVDWKDFRVTL